MELNTHYVGMLLIKLFGGKFGRKIR